MALDGLIDPVASAAGMEAVLASGMADTDRVFRQFLELCEAAGPDRCALAGHGEPVAARVARLLARLRHAPLPAPAAVPPGELTYGETLTILKLATLPDPSIWPFAAAALEEAVQGDGSTIKSAAAIADSDEFRIGAHEQSVALICADSPARHPASAWPRVVDRLEAVSRIGGPVVGWLAGAPCASWPTRSTDRYTGPWNATTKHPILVIGTRFDPTTPLRNARLAARRLGNAVLLIHDGYGHLTRRDPSTCITQAMGSYLVNLTTPPSGTVCPADRLPFDPDFGQPIP
jgi:pimeloyl-ACP methyl ester carboxylesterase